MKPARIDFLIRYALDIFYSLNLVLKQAVKSKDFLMHSLD